MKKLLVLSLVALVFAACSSPSPVKEAVGEDGKVYSALSPDADIQDYGNGVYYFNYTRKDFAKVLSAFIADHPELEFVSMTGDGTDFHGFDAGYFLLFKKKGSETSLSEVSNPSK